jgi:hypothetical protein
MEVYLFVEKWGLVLWFKSKEADVIAKQFRLHYSVSLNY